MTEKYIPGWWRPTQFKRSPQDDDMKKQAKPVFTTQQKNTALGNTKEIKQMKEDKAKKTFRVKNNKN